MGVTAHFQVIPPVSALRRDVECLRVTTHTGNEAFAAYVCPSGYPGVVFQAANGGSSAIDSIETQTARVTEIPSFFLHGQGAEPSVMRFRDVPFTSIQVVFKSHAVFTLFGWDASSLNLGFRLPDQFDACVLEERLLTAATCAERITLLSDFLQMQLAKNHLRDELIERIIEYIQEQIAGISSPQGFVLHQFFIF